MNRAVSLCALGVKENTQAPTHASRIHAVDDSRAHSRVLLARTRVFSLLGNPLAERRVVGALPLKIVQILPNVKLKSPKDRQR